MLFSFATAGHVPLEFKLWHKFTNKLYYMTKKIKDLVFLAIKMAKNNLRNMKVNQKQYQGHEEEEGEEREKVKFLLLCKKG